MGHRHLILAYAATWILQLGYLGWVAAKWAAVRNQEKQQPSYRDTN